MKHNLTCDQEILTRIILAELDVYSLDILATRIIEAEKVVDWGNDEEQTDFFNRCIDALSGYADEEEVGDLMVEAEGDEDKAFLLQAVEDAGLLITIRALLRRGVPFTLESTES